MESRRGRKSDSEGCKQRCLVASVSHAYVAASPFGFGHQEAEANLVNVLLHSANLNIPL